MRSIQKRRLRLILTLTITWIVGILGLLNTVRMTVYWIPRFYNYNDTDDITNDVNISHGFTQAHVDWMQYAPVPFDRFKVPTTSPKRNRTTEILGNESMNTNKTANVKRVVVIFGDSNGSDEIDVLSDYRQLNKLKSSLNNNSIIIPNRFVHNANRPLESQSDRARKEKLNAEKEWWFYRKRSVIMNDFSYGEIRGIEDVCDTGIDKHKHPQLIVIIHSKPDHFEMRDTIRKSWGQRRFNVAIVFLIGSSMEQRLNRKIEIESRKRRDIVQHDYVDVYHSLVSKSIVGLSWVVKNCPTVEFVLKTDDDVMLNIPKVLEILKTQNKSMTLIGAVFKNSVVQRRGRWKVSYDEYPMDVFPPYLGGAAYVMSIDVARLLTDAALYVPQLPIEDAYITGILAKVCDIVPRNIPGFPTWISRGPGPICNFVKGNGIGLHGFNAENVRKIWDWHMTDYQC